MEIALWDRVKDSKDPAELQAYIDRFPQGTFASLAKLMIQRVKREEEQRIAAVREQLLEEARKKAAATGVPSQPAAPPPTTVAALPTPATTPTPPPTTNAAGVPPPDREALTKSLQRELSRVGCNPGAVDGVWGGQTSEALKNFGRHAKVKVQSDEPTPAALEAVTARKDRACPLVCDDDEMVVKGKCVAKPKPAQTAKKKPQTRSAESTTTKRRTTQSDSDGKPKSQTQTQPRQQSPGFRPCLGVISCGIKVLPF
jgi:hypothetical protein